MSFRKWHIVELENSSPSQGSTVKFDSVEIAFILASFILLKPLSDGRRGEGGERGNQSNQRKPLMSSSENGT